MKSFLEQATNYLKHHQTQKTKLCHYVGVGLVVFSLSLLFGWVKIQVPGLVETNLAWLAAIASLAYYARLEWRLALSLVPVFWLTVVIANVFTAAGPSVLSTWLFVLCLVGGLSSLLYGLHLESKPLADVENLKVASIAPMVFAVEVFVRFNKLDDLRLALDLPKASPAESTEPTPSQAANNESHEHQASSNENLSSRQTVSSNDNLSSPQGSAASKKA